MSDKLNINGALKAMNIYFELRNEGQNHEQSFIGMNIEMDVEYDTEVPESYSWQFEDLYSKRNQ